MMMRRTEEKKKIKSNNKKKRQQIFQGATLHIINELIRKSKHTNEKKKILITFLTIFIHNQKIFRKILKNISLVLLNI